LARDHGSHGVVIRRERATPFNSNHLETENVPQISINLAFWHIPIRGTSLLKCLFTRNFISCTTNVFVTAATTGCIHDKIEEALEPILAAIPRRVEEERGRQRIAALLSSAKTHVGTYLHRLYSEEELSYEAICDWEWHRELERIMEAEPRKELSGDETNEELRELVEEILEGQLEGTDEDE